MTTDSNGQWSRPIQATVDYRYYATAGTSTASSLVLLQPMPTINGPALRVIRCNSAYTLTGLGVPGSLVVLHFAQLGAGATPGPYNVLHRLMKPPGSLRSPPDTVQAFAMPLVTR